METTSAPGTAAASISTAVCGNHATTAQSMANVANDNQAVAIVLPIVLLSISINAGLVGVGIFICIVISRRHKADAYKAGGEIVHGYENLETSTKSLKQRPSEEDHTTNSDR